MSAPLKSACAACLLLIACLGTSMLAQSGVIFQDGWDGGVGTGCTETNITDNRAWNEFGPSNTCTAILPSPRSSPMRGSKGPRRCASTSHRMARQTGRTSGSSAPGAPTTTRSIARWYIKYSDNWVFASADHKVAIFGVGNQGSQDIYYNIRGNGGGGPSGRVVIGVSPVDTVYSDPSVEVTPGVWHLCEIHIVVRRERSGRSQIGRSAARISSTKRETAWTSAT